MQPRVETISHPMAGLVEHDIYTRSKGGLSISLRQSCQGFQSISSTTRRLRMALGRALIRRSPSTAARDCKTVLSGDAGERSDAACQRSPNKFGEPVSGGRRRRRRAFAEEKGGGQGSHCETNTRSALCKTPACSNMPSTWAHRIENFAALTATSPNW